VHVVLGEDLLYGLRLSDAQAMDLSEGLAEQAVDLGAVAVGAGSRGYAGWWRPESAPEVLRHLPGTHEKTGRGPVSSK
jgi:hypothetical protein